MGANVQKTAGLFLMAATNTSAIRALLLVVSIVLKRKLVISRRSRSVLGITAEKRREMSPLHGVTTKKSFVAKRKTLDARMILTVLQMMKIGTLRKRSGVVQKRKWVAWTLINVQKVARCFLMAATHASAIVLALLSVAQVNIVKPRRSRSVLDITVIVRERLGMKRKRNGVARNWL